MSDTTRRRVLYIVLVALAGIVACVAFAAASAQPCRDPDPCGVEPAPAPVLYLPAVLQRLPAMASEFTPVQPVATVTPEVSGDVQGMTYREMTIEERMTQ